MRESTRRGTCTYLMSHPSLRTRNNRYNRLFYSSHFPVLFSLFERFKRSFFAHCFFSILCTKERISRDLVSLGQKSTAWNKIWSFFSRVSSGLLVRRPDENWYSKSRNGERERKLEEWKECVEVKSEKNGREKRGKRPLSDFLSLSPYVSLLAGLFL